ncbi:spore coat protein [candidate division MSBL1 archaeon SCGC-AAA259A05]|uniref:Spore coat protein n=1 Tax=candidate division MSBL1 archaeon SCGC-AAA259A05 TaxID=1698259 RepID=A0A133UBU4_9EURY|nr:spore coat protein [candidate division MSBL1 archaeon SCGC-AAA259A05]
MGFIGSNFVRNQMQKYESLEIINLDNLSMGSNLENLSDFEKEDRYTFEKGSIANQDLLAKLVPEIDLVVNFAAETHVDRSISNPNPFFKSNAEGVYSILEVLRESSNNPRLVHISTDEVYGEIEKGSFDEDSLLDPSNPYSATKASADMLILSYCNTYGIDASITRCTNNFGPYQFPEKLIPKTIIRSLNNLKIPVYGTGENIRDWIFVKDHCDAIDLVARKGESGEIYNISSGYEVENIELVKKILNVVGKPTDLIEFVEDRPGHDLRYSLDSTKIREDLDWKPEKSLDQALKKTVDWYMENEDWWNSIADEKILSPRPWEEKW